MPDDLREQVLLEMGNALADLADLHHKTLTNSRKHNPARIDSFNDCDCLSCNRASAALSKLDALLAERQAPPTDLREQVKNALLNHGHKPENELLDDLADAVLAVFAERERLLRERIEIIEFDALPRSQFALGAQAMKQRVLAVFDDEPQIESCPICGGILDHVVGYAEMDKPR